MTAKLAEFCREKDKHLIFNDDEYKIFWRNNPPIDAKTCKRDAFLGLFFDGTNNNKYRDLPKRAAKDDEAAKINSASNVARLFAALGGLSMNSIRTTSSFTPFNQPYCCPSQSI